MLGALRAGFNPRGRDHHRFAPTPLRSLRFRRAAPGRPVPRRLSASLSHGNAGGAADAAPPSASTVWSPNVSSPTACASMETSAGVDLRGTLPTIHVFANTNMIEGRSSPQRKSPPNPGSAGRTRPRPVRPVAFGREPILVTSAFASSAYCAPRGHFGMSDEDRRSCSLQASAGSILFLRE